MSVLCHTDFGGGDKSAAQGEDAYARDWFTSGACSFTSQTEVTTDQGKRPISKLHPGDQVWAYNPKTHQMELQPILHVWIHQDDDLVDLTITFTQSTSSRGKVEQPKNEVVHTNKKHPFLTIEKGFLPVGQITLGMHMQRADGSTGLITGWKLIPGVKTMYNLEVAQDHTFTVGNGQWVVHNLNCTYSPKIAKQMTKRGWNDALLQDAVDNPDHTVSTKDVRYDPATNTKVDKGSATAYYSKSGGYVVRNDATGDIVQVSNRSDPGWTAPWDSSSTSSSSGP